MRQQDLTTLSDNQQEQKLGKKKPNLYFMRNILYSKWNGIMGVSFA